MSLRTRVVVGLFCVTLAGVAAPVSFIRDIRPLLRSRCVACHGPTLQSAGLRLDRRDDALRGGYSGLAIQPGKSADSRLYRIVGAGIDVGGKRLRMPPTGDSLPGNDVDLIRRWIDEGASWPVEPNTAERASAPSRHWSFQPIRKPDIPRVKRSDWVRNPIDAFVLAGLERARIDPSPEASKTTLLRRVYLDLTGLLPDPDETAAFLADTSPDAYDRVIDRLLASSHYGEKWARPWLDLARYADSEGGVQDYLRPYAWRYREWVIHALNRDMSFDRFTVEQMAGDLLPSSTLDQKLATGFHRNTETSREGGIDLEKLRFDQLVDRTNTVGTTWLGLTVGCAQCHDHKYDPITQKDYYRLLAFFDNSVELDLEAPRPGELGPYRQNLPHYRAERQRLLEQYGVAPLQADWEANLRDAAAHPGRRTDWDGRYDSFSKLVDNGPQILAKQPEARSPREQESLTNYFVRYAEGVLGKKKFEELRYKELHEKLTALSTKFPPLSVVMTLAEESTRRPTYLRVRGNYKDNGIEVNSGTPGWLPAMKPNGPVDRLALARWLVSDDNPLTARVAVNRSWQELFGRGLVRTPEDFGAQGDKPSHPELLDWLAWQFKSTGWSMKALHRLIVTSSTYRQASRLRPELGVHDPGNALLARQSRMRLPAELIRDAALVAGGLLLDTIGGESVRPPQPEGVADLSYSLKWVETTGRERYRRGIYVQTQRTALYPMLGNFDAPDRTVTCARREVSNTPLQALNLMNDPVFAEAAQALAARILKEARTDSQRVDRAFQICYSRLPSSAERDLILSYLGRRRQLAEANPDSAKAMPVADLPPEIRPGEALAWFGVSRALLNADEFLTRE